MLDQSYYAKADEIMDQYGRKPGFTDSDYAGDSGSLPLSARRAAELCG